MNVRHILATAAFCTLLTGAGLAQVTGQSIQNRKYDQQGRILQGDRSGQLTRGETRNLESRERSVNREEHAMRRADGGHLTAGDKGRADAPAEQYFAFDLQRQAQRPRPLNRELNGPARRDAGGPAAWGWKPPWDDKGKER